MPATADRVRAFPEIVDRGVDAFVQRMPLMLGIAAIDVLPLGVTGGFNDVTIPLLGVFRAAAIAPQSTVFFVPVFDTRAIVLRTIFGFVWWTLVGGAAVIAVGGAFAGEPAPSPWRLARRSLRRLPAAIGAMALMVGVLVACLAPVAIVGAAAYALASAVVHGVVPERAATIVLVATVVPFAAIAAFTVAVIATTATIAHCFCFLETKGSLAAVRSAIGASFPRREWPRAALLTIAIAAVDAVGGLIANPLGSAIVVHAGWVAGAVAINIAASCFANALTTCVAVAYFVDLRLRTTGGDIAAALHELRG